MKYSADPTLVLRSDVSFNYVFIIYSSVPSEQGGNPLLLSTLPPSTRMFSFDWNDLVQSCIPSFATFHIIVKVNLAGVYQIIVYEGSSTSILSSLCWKNLGSPKIVSVGEMAITEG
jgi:hypothetical protein